MGVNDDVEGLDGIGWIELELQIVDPTGEIEERVVRGQAPLSIGRAATCDLRIPDATVSAHHAWLWLEEDSVPRIRDADSRHGTFVNDDRLDGEEVRRLGPTDQVWLGEIRLTSVRVHVASDDPSEQSMRSGTEPKRDSDKSAPFHVSTVRPASSTPGPEPPAATASDSSSRVGRSILTVLVVAGALLSALLLWMLL